MEIKKLAFKTKMKWWAGYNNEDGESLHYYLYVYLGKESDYEGTISKILL